MYRLTSKGMTCLYKTSIWTRTLEFCCSPTLPLSCQNLPGFQIHRYLTDNKRSVHKHCCLSPKNTHGSGHAVNLLHFTLLLNLTTAVLLEGNSAWMSVGAAQQSTLWEVHKGIELFSLLHSSCGWPTGLRTADAYSLCASLLLLIFFKKYFTLFHNLPFCLLVGLSTWTRISQKQDDWSCIALKKDKLSSWIYTYPLNTVQLPLLYPSWIQWGEWVLWDSPAAREKQENWMTPGTCIRYKWAKQPGCPMNTFMNCTT